MNCPICLERYNLYDKTPYILSCGHIVCHECIKAIREDEQNRKEDNSIFITDIQCPLCRFISNYNTIPICHNICDYIKEQNQSNQLCMLHFNQIAKYFCIEDKEVICNLCLVDKHKGHKIKLISEEMNRQTFLEKLETWKTVLDQKKDQYQKNKMLLDSIKNNISSQRDMEIKNIEDIFDKYPNDKNKVLNKIKETASENSNIIKTLQNKINPILDEYKQNILNNKTDNYTNCFYFISHYKEIKYIIQNTNLLNPIIHDNHFEIKQKDFSQLKNM